jgi:hypothetical protein
LSTSHTEACTPRCQARTGGEVASRYAEWQLGLTEGAAEHTEARYAFVYGDFRRLHRMGLIACHHRAAEWRHEDIELAAHELLQLLDARSG